MSTAELPAVPCPFCGSETTRFDGRYVTELAPEGSLGGWIRCGEDECGRDGFVWVRLTGDRVRIEITRHPLLDQGH
jgi:hypothetical protein